MKHKLTYTSLVVSLLFSSATTSQAEEVKITRMPYIQLATENSQVIVWRTDGLIEPMVRIGKLMDRLDIPKEKILVKHNKHLSQGGAVTRAPEGTMQYEAYISDLKPDTTYYYAI